MIAPSPDWIVFVSGLDLRYSDNSGWQQDITLDFIRL